MPAVWPTHAHLPGLNARHPDSAFDAIRATARPGMTSEALASSDAFVHGLLYLDKGFYWEAHEVLEPVWLALPEGSAERVFVQGLIQLAKGLLKERMGRPDGARRLIDKARAQLDAGDGHKVMGIPRTEAQGRVVALQKALEASGRRPRSSNRPNSGTRHGQDEG